MNEEQEIFKADQKRCPVCGSYVVNEEPYDQRIVDCTCLNCGKDWTREFGEDDEPDMEPY